jgi:DNA segregation ATPase FtsK/SpoIIIE, S-DNA-T family
MAKSAPKSKTKPRRGRAGGTGSRFLGILGRLRDVALSLVVGRELEDRARSQIQEVLGLLLVGLSIWLGLSLFSYYQPYNDPWAAGKNWGGEIGFYLASWVLSLIGWAGYMLSLLGLAWGAVAVSGRQVAFPLLRVVGGVFFLLSSAFLLQLALGQGFVVSPGQNGTANNHLPFGPGGWLALESIGPSPNHIDAGSAPLVEKFGRPGLWILLSLIALSSFTLATERAFFPALTAFVGWLRHRREAAGEGIGSALGGFLLRLGRGWWDFLTGADLALEPAVVGRGGKRSLARIPAKGTPRAAQRRSKKSRPADADEPEEDEDSVDLSDELVPRRGRSRAAVELDEADAEEDEEDEESAELEDADEEEWEEVDEDESDAADDPQAEFDEDEEEEEDSDSDADSALREPTPEERAAAREKLKKTIKTPTQLAFDPPTPPPGPWRFPTLDLLEPPDPKSANGGKDPETIAAEAERLESVLRSFRVEASVCASTVGPAVTLYELEVASGTRMNKVTTLSQEIAAALRARSIRTIAPIPGKSTIGIEVPNEKRRVVRLSELIHQKAYDKKHAALPLFLGVNAQGEPVVEDLARMPHLLIAGQTGAGKSVCINTIIASLLLTRSPHDVQMIMIDPKMVELQMYSEVPHQMCPVVTDMKQATRVLEWAVEKMEGRYDLFKTAGVRNIKGYNALGEEGLRKAMGDDFNAERTPRYVPYIVIVIDEMADLMMVSKKEAEQAITRLAQKSRAVGIHVIVATQRPSTDVITGVLKANLPTRIAFTVASKIDSRVILDAQGAEKLLGFGDMLYNPPQASQLERVQGALVEDHELQAIVDFVCQESAPNFSQELIQAATGESRGGEDEDFAAKDDLWDEAVRIILKSRRGSASLLQRALGVGYTRASRLVDLMTEAGILGIHKGSKSREVLLTLEDWEEMHGAEPISAERDD